MTAALALWVLSVIGGGWWIYARSFEPGAAGDPGSSWPADSRITSDPILPTLVLALHPECTCSSATLDELADVLEEARGRLAVRVLMADYDDLETRPENSELWRKAAALPGIAIFADRDCAEIQRFHARTSGEARLYDPAGRLVFRGGITLSRGHAGANPGAQAVRDLALGAARSTPASISSTPVFGCAL